MSDLNSGARRILEAARHADDPSDEDRMRVRRSFFARVSDVGARASVTGWLASRGKQRWRGFGWTISAAVVAATAAVSAAGIRARQKIAAPTPNPQPALEDGVDARLRLLPQARGEVQDHAEAPAKHESLPRPPAVSPHAGNERYALELKVLQPARAAVARDDFLSALAAIAEHERRFPEGQLAEEREALRVQALLGLQRTEEASRAAAAFRERFPGSVLLSRMRKSLHP